MTRDTEQLCRLFFSGFVDAPTTIKPPGERFMADTLSSDDKKVVQGLHDAIAAGDVERFFGAMHSQFQAELPGYLPWGGIS
jgi:hypothetical protein